jgi:hypothetical protein
MGDLETHSKSAENCQVGHLAENCDEKRVAGNLPARTSGGEFGLNILRLRIKKSSPPDATKRRSSGSEFSLSLGLELNKSRWIPD